jgi:hypothetical protein
MRILATMADYEERRSVTRSGPEARHGSVKLSSKVALASTKISKMFLSALGLELMCFFSASTGQTIAIYWLGFNQTGITVGYLSGFALAGFLTLCTIIGRMKTTVQGSLEYDGCSLLDHSSPKGFVPSLKSTVYAFLRGIRLLYRLPSTPDSGAIIKNALRILITAESCCIITAEIVDLIFYRSTQLLSIPLGIAGGAASIMLIELIRNSRKRKS